MTTEQIFPDKFIAAVAFVLGLVMLRASRHAGGGQLRDRRRWAAQKEWEYLDSDPVLPSRWRYGTIHQGGPGVARNLVTGSVPTAEGRRLVYVFDHEQAGRLSSVVCAVQRRTAMSGAVELRLPSAPLPDDAGLNHLADHGVIDPYHRVYGHEGLHIVDGSAVSAKPAGSL